MFKSNVSVQQSSSLLSLTYLITNKASRAFEHYLQVEVSSTSIFQSSVTKIVSSSTEVFIEDMRRWDGIKDLKGSINTDKFFLAFEVLDGEVYRHVLCINCFTFKN